MSDLTEGPLLRAILRGEWVDPESGRPLVCPIRAIRITKSLDGGEDDCIAGLGLGPRIAVVADGATWSALGRRVARNLSAAAAIDAVVLREPHGDADTVAVVLERSRHASGIVAVGAGVVNDVCKAAAAKSSRPYAVFGTAASMNGYTTGTVSLSTADGLKTTAAANMPRGVFLDLAVLAEAPIRLARAGLGDSICRTTAQTDWLLSHVLFDTPYSTTPYRLQLEDEQPMFDLASGLQERNLAALAALCRVLLLTGLGTILTGTSQYGSGAEHLVSHAIDRLAGPLHPGSLHGEQVGVATLCTAALQAGVLQAPTAPVVSARDVDWSGVAGRFGPIGVEQFRRKTLTPDRAERLNARLAERWPVIREQVSTFARSLDQLDTALRLAGAPRTPDALGLDRRVFARAAGSAREMRDRYTILDLAADSGLLDGN